MDASFDSVADILIKHARAYPEMQLVDAIKLLYQNEFGPGHMISDPAGAYKRLAEECRSVGSDTYGLECFEDIGNGLFRFNISCIQASGISIETVSNCFCYTANTVKGSIPRFIAKLDMLKEICGSGSLLFDKVLAKEFINKYIAEGCPQPHHSMEYKKAYRPAYRVMLAGFKQYYKLFCAVDSCLASDKNTITVAIDGRCLSGKSTLAALLSEIYDCNIFSMDDFFLPAKLQTSERLALPGGNVDIERFRSDVLDKLEKDVFWYSRFDCGTQSYKAPEAVIKKRLNVVEGSYSLHPTLRSYYDIKVLLTIDKSKQLSRLKLRDSEASQQQFIDKWIPLEEDYHSKTRPEAICDIII